MDISEDMENVERSEVTLAVSSSSSIPTCRHHMAREESHVTDTDKTVYWTDKVHSEKVSRQGR